MLAEAQARGYAEADPTRRRRGPRRGAQAGHPDRASRSARGRTRRASVGAHRRPTGDARPASRVSGPSTWRAPLGWAWPSSSWRARSATPEGARARGRDPDGRPSDLAAGHDRRRHQPRRGRRATRSAGCRSGDRARAAPRPSSAVLGDLLAIARSAWLDLGVAAARAARRSCPWRTTSRASGGWFFVAADAAIGARCPGELADARPGRRTMDAVVVRPMPLDAIRARLAALGIETTALPRALGGLSDDAHEPGAPAAARGGGDGAARVRA